MDNSFFILSDQQVVISRFHICTWDIENTNSFIEIGIEFKPINEGEFNFRFAAPLVGLNSEVKCLADNLCIDTNNSKFIFNDNIESLKPIDGDTRNGAILTFGKRDKLAIIPIEPFNINSQIVGFKVKTPIQEFGHTYYIRFSIRINCSTLSTVKRGIAKTSLIYDIKLNEKRNLPNDVHNLIKNNYHLCKVENCFCFHVIPNDLNISYVDKKLKNIRELEVKAFKNYLPVELEKMKENRYIIIFNKASNEESYSFFSVFTKEIIGTNQILLAIGTNILCSLLFANATFRSAYNPDISIWKQIPIEFWLAFSILIIVGVSLFYPVRRVK